MLLTRSFAAYAFFVLLVMVPVSIYFYVFHGDWSLLYLVDVRKVPSAFALIGFVIEGGVGALGFAVGAALVRSQRENAAAGLAFGAILCGALVVAIGFERLALVGTFAQYRGGFGLTPYGSGSLLHGTIVMTLLLVAGLVYLLARLLAGGRRGA